MPLSFIGRFHEGRMGIRPWVECDVVYTNAALRIRADYFSFRFLGYLHPIHFRARLDIRDLVLGVLDHNLNVRVAAIRPTSGG